ncbi:tetratricopeptide repeat-containing sulfotransferase family protein [Alcanivorax jadensis]|uniref:tetratricopeptide repeat-containing sulfotransferase family protein n=1 Tax=Alcanivorax jadensis TaxID=64988 RepID=UPI002409902F|nr:sulfotransferase [Alcanivorax jadensis]MDF1637188.1 sulfotransferase [Alcanivorax jadensis]
MDQVNINQIMHVVSQKLAGGDAHGAALITENLIESGQAIDVILELHAQASADLGNVDVAISCIEEVIQSAGPTVNRAIFYGDMLLRKKRWQGAADIFQQVIKQKDDIAQAWLGLGHALSGAGDVERACRCYSAAVEREPSNNHALLKMGACLLYLGDALRALEALKPVYESKLGSLESTYYYAEALRQSSCIEEAKAIFGTLVDDPEWGPKAARSLVFCLLSLERFDEAQQLLEIQLENHPDDMELLASKSRLLTIEGNVEGAKHLLEIVIEKGDVNLAVWEAYVELLTEPMSEQKLAKLHEHRLALEKLGQKRLVAGTHFAAYGHYSLLGNVENEIAELYKANALMAELEPFDWQKHRENVRVTREGYPSPVIAKLSTDEESFRSVHLLCTPRSGSTLLEQALARHSKFWAGGEKNFAGEAWYGITGKFSLTTMPETHQKITPAQVAQFRDEYLASVRRAGWQDGQWMVHKGINAHKFAGLLKSAFPNAKFIELRRNPMDVAFGCYRQNFESQPFSYTAEGCASEIACYQENMHWWHKQMPEAIRVVNYEDLVANFGSQIQDLLHWLGLDWEEECLDFSRKSRVATASVNQVRQGLFTKGVGRWKRYGDLLAPLQKALEKQGVDLE